MLAQAIVGLGEQECWSSSALPLHECVALML